MPVTFDGPETLEDAVLLGLLPMTATTATLGGNAGNIEIIYH